MYKVNTCTVYSGFFMGRLKAVTWGEVSVRFSISYEQESGYSRLTDVLVWENAPGLSIFFFIRGHFLGVAFHYPT